MVISVCTAVSFHVESILRTGDWKCSYNKYLQNAKTGWDYG